MLSLEDKRYIQMHVIIVYNFELRYCTPYMGTAHPDLTHACSFATASNENFISRLPHETSADIHIAYDTQPDTS